MSQSKILKLMRFVLINPEKYTEGKIKKKFGEKNYDLFSQFCIGGPSEMQLAHYPDHEHLKLTQKGVREYHKLQSENSQKKFNFLMLITTIVLALSSTALVILTWIRK